MKTPVPTPSPRHPRGYVSFVVVLSMTVLLTSLMLFAYRRSIEAHGIQADIQIQHDYAEKEEAILRSIVSITPNRAIRAMQHNSNSSSTTRNPLR